MPAANQINSADHLFLLQATDAATGLLYLHMRDILHRDGELPLLPSPPLLLTLPLQPLPLLLGDGSGAAPCLPCQHCAVLVAALCAL